MNGRVRVGFVGCGRIVLDHHLGILARWSNAEVVALADPNPQRLAAAQTIAPLARAYNDFAELLQQSDVEAVIISVPSWLHAEAAVAALEAGKHIYLEKPLATTLTDGQRIVTIWRRTGLKGMIGFNYRASALNRKARELLQTGELGDIGLVRSFFSDSVAGLPDWLHYREKGGGALLELASHHFDLLPYLLGSPIVSVQATVKQFQSEGDYVAVNIRLGSGLLAQSCFMFGSAHDDRIEVYGERYKLIVERFRSLQIEPLDRPGLWHRLRRMRHLAEGLGRSSLLGDRVLSPKVEMSYEAALEHFVECVRLDREPQPDLADGFRSLATVIACEESAQTGKAAPLPEPDWVAKVNGDAR